MVPEPVLEVESEEEYLDKWWTNSAVGGPGRRSTLGGGSCTTLDGVVWWDEPG